MLLAVLVGELAYAAWSSDTARAGVEVASVGVESTAPDPQTSLTPTTVHKIVRASPTTLHRATTATSKPAVSAPIVGPGSVTYTVAAGTVVKVVATGRCWVQARRGSNGAVLDDVILKAGETKSYTSPLWMRIGDTSKLTVTGGSTRLQLPPTTGNLIVNPG